MGLWVTPLTLAGHVVAVTASQDVSREVKEANGDLFESLLILGAIKVALLVLAIIVIVIQLITGRRAL